MTSFFSSCGYLISTSRNSLILGKHSPTRRHVALVLPSMDPDLPVERRSSHSETAMKKVDGDETIGNESSVDDDRGKVEEKPTAHPFLVAKDAGIPLNVDDNVSKKTTKEAKARSQPKKPAFFSLSSFLKFCFTTTLLLPFLALLFFLFHSSSMMVDAKSVVEGQDYSKIYVTSVASFSSLAPIGIEAIIDLIQDTSKLHEIGFVTNALMLISALFPPVLILLLPLFHASETLLPSLFLPLAMFQVQSWTSFCLLRLHKISPTQFTAPVLFSLYSLLLFALISLATCSLEHVPFVQMFARFFLLAFTLTFSYTLMQAFYLKTIQSYFQWSQVMKSSHDFELLATSLNCFLSLLLIAFVVSFFSSSSAFCTALIVIFSLHMLIANIFSLRVFKTTVTQLQRDLNVKRTFVRYVGHEVRTPLNTIGMVMHTHLWAVYSYTLCKRFLYRVWIWSSES